MFAKSFDELGDTEKSYAMADILSDILLRNTDKAIFEWLLERRTGEGKRLLGVLSVEELGYLIKSAMRRIDPDVRRSCLVSTNRIAANLSSQFRLVSRRCTGAWVWPAPGVYVTGVEMRETARIITHPFPMPFLSQGSDFHRAGY